MVEMRKLLAGALALTAIAQAQEPKQPSVVDLTATRADGVTTGRAFFAVKDGVAVTAWHVVAKAAKVTAKAADGQEFEVAGIVDKDEKRDVALVRVRVSGRPLLAFAAKEPAVGDNAFVAAPAGRRDATIGLIQVLDGVKQIQFECAVGPEDAGAPLLDAKGEVVGIVTRPASVGGTASSAVPAEFAKGLDATLPTQPWQAPNAEDPTTPAAAKTDAEMDELLVQGLAAGHNAAVAFTQSLEWWYERKGYKGGAHPQLYARARKVQTAWMALDEASTADPTRAQMRKLVADGLLAMSTTLDLAVKVGVAIQRDEGWTSRSKDRLNQAVAAMAECATSSRELGELAKSIQGFEARCDRAVAENLGLRKGAPLDAFDVGLLTDYSQRQMYYVHKNGKAWKLGFRPCDVVLTLDGVRIRNVYDLFEKLRAAKPGKQTVIEVERDEKVVKLKFAVPKDWDRL